MASDLIIVGQMLELAISNLATIHQEIASALKAENQLICLPTTETIWQEVFLSSFKLFRDMDTTLPPSEVRDLAVADANCVVETLRQKAEDVSTQTGV